MIDDDEKTTGWGEDKILSAIADVEDRLGRSQRALSKRIERLERSRHSGEFGDLGEQVTTIATTVLIAYAIFVMIRIAMVWQQQRQA